MNADQALALILDCGLTKHQYLMLKKKRKKIWYAKFFVNSACNLIPLTIVYGLMQDNLFLGADMYPSYADVLEAKKHCYPNGTVSTDDEIINPLQSLVDHNTERVFSY